MSAPSYVCGLSSMPLTGETIGEHFDEAATRWPDREALVVRHQNIRWNYAELKRRVDELAAGFLGLDSDQATAWEYGRLIMPSGCSRSLPPPKLE